MNSKRDFPLTKSALDLSTYETFFKFISEGATITSATYLTMKERNIVSPITIYNIRRRVEKNFPEEARKIRENANEILASKNYD